MAQDRRAQDRETQARGFFRGHARAYAAETKVLRYASDLMRLAMLCRRATCRRAGRCRGEPRDCLGRFAPLVPEEARDWAKAAIEGRRQGCDFEQVRADHPEAFAALIGWHAALDRAFRR